MAIERLIVDGYNVIHNVGDYKESLQKDVALAVSRLIDDLSALKGTTGWEICVVFDGRQSAADEIAGVEIFYTAKGKTADAIIERLSYAVGEGETLVATADYQQQKTIFRPGVRRMTPRELSGLISEAHRELSELAADKRKTVIEDQLSTDVRHKLDKLRKKKEY